MDTANTPTIYQFSLPTSASSKPPQSSNPILTPGYELRPCFINMIREQSFSGEGEANPYSHLRVSPKICMVLNSLIQFIIHMFVH
jgi:hypothetical protein